MRAHNRCKIVGFTALVVLFMATHAHAHRNDILMVPARARMIRLAFDLQALRGPTLISYRATEDPLQPLLHVWNRANRDWQQIDIANISQAQNIPATPTRAYIIGLHHELPEAIPAALSHAADLRILNTLSVAEILTVLDRDMQFNIEEWRTLAARYNLEITELNYERRRWGRFGPPRRYRDQTTPDQPKPPARDVPVAPLPAEPEKQAAATAPEPVTEPEDPQPEQTTDREALLEYILEYEPTPLDPVPETAETTTEPEKGLRDAPPSEDLTETSEEDFPIK